MLLENKDLRLLPIVKVQQSESQNNLKIMSIWDMFTILKGVKLGISLNM